jgi:iron-sulfur cluster repair protein YtfE (RIC family)
VLVKIEPLKEPGDIVDQFLECHERIRSFASLACRLATTNELSHDEIRDAAARVFRYFSEALPFHVADEELSVVPRLAGKRPELDAALHQMQEEHLAHEANVQVLVETCSALKASPAMLGDLHDTLLHAASTLEIEFTTHLKQEEETIFPAIRSLLTAEERAMMLAELRERRDSKT